MFNLDGKKAIVTGGASGLAYGIAEGLMEAGADLVIIDIAGQTEEVARKFSERGFTCHGVRANLGDRKELEEAFNKSVDLLGGNLDILVPAAGIQRRNKIEDFSLEDWDAVININLSAVFSLCQMAARVMLKNGSGKIINIASMLSYFGGYTVPAYAASKGGVAQLTKAMANELASQGINVNAIAPGYMATKMNINIIEDEARNESITNRIPAKRWGTPEDLKGVAVFLSSEASDYINGAIIPVDGGYLGC